MLMTSHYWHHQEQVWYLCWKSVRVLRGHDILFNASKTIYMIFKRCESVNTAPLYFRNMPINCVHECDLLGITLSSSRTTDNVIEKAVMKFNMKSNEILLCYIKSKLFTTWCTDAYGCQLWNFESREVHNLYVAWRKDYSLQSATHN